MLFWLYWKDFDLRVHNKTQFAFNLPRNHVFENFFRIFSAIFSPFTFQKDVVSAMNSFQILLVELMSLSVLVHSFGTQNLTCYQCIKNSNEECGPEHLLPCPKVADRCVTHISRHAGKGYQIKRECGLGPCQFEDDMINKGLGMNGCDRSKDEYFCVFCCKTDGCNKNGSLRVFSVKELLAVFTLSYLLIKALL